MAVDAGSTRRAVLDTTLSIVAADGLPAVTLARIGTGSGVSNGSVYHHFGSREGVLRALLVDCFASLTTALGPALDERAAEVCVRDLVRRHLRWVATEHGAATVIYGVSLDDTVVGNAASAAVVTAKAKATDPLMAWFAARAAAGEIRAVPAWALDPVALAPVHETARRWLVTRSGDLDEVGAVVADAVWAILEPPARLD